MALGQAILPVWVLDDGTYAFDDFLTGEFSVGVSNRMGAYAFVGTEPRVLGTHAGRRRLAGLRQDLDEPTLGLDLSRMDMVAALGLDAEAGGSGTRG